MKTYQRILFSWLPWAVMVTLVALFVYGAVQQDLRQGANDPQVQLAEDSSALLNQGQSPSIFSASMPTDISKSLGTFIIVYDSTGKILNSTAALSGVTLVPPQGVFQKASAKGQNNVTWQPARGVRVAAVVMPFKNNTSSGYVLVGRSLREVEIQEHTLLMDVIAGWVIGLVVMFVVVWLDPRNRQVVPVM